MKTTIRLLLLLLGSLAWASAQTAEDYINLGRTSLAAHNLTNADSDFMAALALSPSHATGNVLRAATRLLIVPNQPAGAALLDRLGVAPTNRSIYNWTATVARDSAGLPLAPPNFSATELSAFLRTNLLQQLIDSEANLATVTDTNFLLTLSSNETALATVTLDYGDLLLMRASLQAAEYLSYTVNSWNLDIQLTAIHSLFETPPNPSTAQAFLAQYPELFTFATTNDMTSARQAFTNAAALYQAASTFIRNRPPGIVRLFNLDPDKASSEAEFRTTVAELVQSLNGPVVLSLDTNLTVSAGPLFTGQNPPRAFLPQISGNAIVAGTLPDPSFGGIVQGFSDYQLQQLLSKKFRFVPHVAAPQPMGGGVFQFSFSGLNNTVLAVQVSSNLLTWNDAGLLLVQSGSASILDTNHSARVFYRTLELPDALSVAGNVVDVGTLAPIVGAPAVLSFPSDSTLHPVTNLTDKSGNFVLIYPSSPPSGEYVVTVSPADHASYSFQGYSWNGQHATLAIYSTAVGYHPPNDNFAQATILAGNSLSLTAFNNNGTRETGEPKNAGAAGGASIWWQWTAPGNGPVVVDTIGSAFDTTLGIYTGSSVSTLTTIASDDDSGGKSTSRLTFPAVGGTTYFISVDGFSGNTGKISLHLNYTP